jgi:hypothetical protein
MKPSFVITFALAALLTTAQAAEVPSSTPQPPSAREPYAPGLGEIMTLTQMRHSKLWLAGKAANWALADYELDQLKEGFDDAAKLFPTFKQKVPVATMINEISSTILVELKGAIDAKDRSKFTAAFDKLTHACNGCHQTADHGFIVIQRPTESPFTNQSFSVKSK